MIAQTNNTFPETGNVGIGTENPSATLHVVGTVQLESLPTNSRPDSTDFELKIKGDGTVYKSLTPYSTIGVSDACLLGSAERQAPVWKNGFDKIFTYCGQTKVGIATHNPRVSLDVMGTTFSKKLYVGLSDPLLGANNTSPYFHLKTTYSTLLADQTVFLVENTTRKLLQIENNGMVRAREIKVDLANTWPDYVFQPNYSLMPLKDVKTFIEENGHLPNIPDAETTEEEGIPLGEMNRLLLEKVEELTLYMIQMQEEQERLKLELEELRIKN